MSLGICRSRQSAHEPIATGVRSAPLTARQVERLDGPGLDDDVKMLPIGRTRRIAGAKHGVAIGYAEADRDCGALRRSIPPPVFLSTKGGGRVRLDIHRVAQPCSQGVARNPARSSDLPHGWKCVQWRKPSQRFGCRHGLRPASSKVRKNCLSQLAVSGRERVPLGRRVVRDQACHTS